MSSVLALCPAVGKSGSYPHHYVRNCERISLLKSIVNTFLYGRQLTFEYHRRCILQTIITLLFEILKSAAFTGKGQQTVLYFCDIHIMLAQDLFLLLYC